MNEIIKSTRPVSTEASRLTAFRLMLSNSTDFGSILKRVGLQDSHIRSLFSHFSGKSLGSIDQRTSELPRRQEVKAYVMWCYRNGISLRGKKLRIAQKRLAEKLGHLPTLVGEEQIDPEIFHAFFKDDSVAATSSPMQQPHNTVYTKSPHWAGLD